MIGIFRFLFFSHVYGKCSCIFLIGYCDRLLSRCLGIISGYSISIFSFFKGYGRTVAVLCLHGKSLQIQFFSLYIIGFIRTADNRDALKYRFRCIAFNPDNRRYGSVLRIQFFFCRHIENQSSVCRHVYAFYRCIPARIKQTSCSGLSQVGIRIGTGMINQCQVTVFVPYNGIMAAAYMGRSADLSLISVIGTQQRIIHVCPVCRIKQIASFIRHHKSQCVEFIYCSSRIAHIYLIAVIKQEGAFYNRLVNAFRILGRDAAFKFSILPGPFAYFKLNLLPVDLRYNSISHLCFRNQNPGDNIIALSGFFILPVGHIICRNIFQNNRLAPLIGIQHAACIHLFLGSFIRDQDRVGTPCINIKINIFRDTLGSEIMGSHKAPPFSVDLMELRRPEESAPSVAGL